MLHPLLLALALLVGSFASLFLAAYWFMTNRPITVEEIKEKATELRKTQAKVPFNSAAYVNDGKFHLLLCATGSVATIKIPLIVEALATRDDISIRLVLTKSATEFLRGQAAEQPTLRRIQDLKNVDGIYYDHDEWNKPWIRGDSILHIELRRWADLMAIVPLSANSLAKLALGFSDNLVSSVARAWDATGVIDTPRPGISFPYASGKRKGIMVAPAMNTAMWEHPVTSKHIAVLEKEWGFANGGWFEVLRPQEKTLACGDTGSGAMMDWKLIVSKINARLATTTAANED